MLNNTGSISVNREDLEHVVRLAALIDDRGQDEHAALVRVAVKLDCELNKATTWNVARRGNVAASALLEEVGGRVPKTLCEKWERARARWREVVA